jgi:hypothetical protein
MIRTSENAPSYKVIAVRNSGEQIIVSTHASQETADVAANLIRNCAGFSEIHIESGGRRGRRRRRRVV